MNGEGPTGVAGPEMAAGGSVGQMGRTDRKGLELSGYYQRSPHCSARASGKCKQWSVWKNLTRLPIVHRKQSPSSWLQFKAFLCLAPSLL